MTRKSVPDSLLVYTQAAREHTFPFASVCGQKAWATDRSIVNQRAAVWAKKDQPDPSAEDLRMELMGLSSSEPTFFEAANDPISGLRLLGPEDRYNRQVMKVVTPQGYIFDLTMPEFYSAMCEEGVTPGGILGGSFVWYFFNNQGVLIRTGTPLHDAVVGSEYSTRSHSLYRKEPYTPASNPHVSVSGSHVPKSDIPRARTALKSSLSSFLDKGLANLS